MNKRNRFFWWTGAALSLMVLLGTDRPSCLAAVGTFRVQDEPPVADAVEAVPERVQDEGENGSPAVEKPVDINENTMDQFVRGLRSLRKHSRLAPEMVDLFSPSVGSTSASTVRLYHNKKQVAIGVVVDANGLVITKASELRMPLECQLPNGARVAAQVFGIDPATDLAMLRVEAGYPLAAADLRPIPAPPVGRWIASVAVDPKPISLGVVSVMQREIASAQARLGIMPVDHEKGVRITSINDKSPADKADLRVNDIITRVGETPIPDSATLRKVLTSYEPGDAITITVLRLDKELTVHVVLYSAEEMNSMGQENPQERMGSTLTTRKQRYPLAFQHDSGLQANQCGSPLVDLDGQIVGINIARAGRVATYALPMEIILPTVERLRSGELAPAAVFREELAVLDTLISERRSRIDALPGELAKAEQELPRDAAKREELERTIVELQKRIDELQQIESGRRKSLDEMQKELEWATSDLQKLQDKRDKLLSGIR